MPSPYVYIIFGKNYRLIQTPLTTLSLVLFSGQVYAAYEYAQYGNLRSFLRKNSMPESQRDGLSSTGIAAMTRGRPMKFAKHIALGMEYLANKNVSFVEYNVLKPDCPNVLDQHVDFIFKFSIIKFKIVTCQGTTSLN